uniref:Reverse transcriptase Ty1/copia-type domain-containing protein n=1 Tax=Fagus sylvatica TaxID=28930 RepID=A0A2N9HJG1_FAGSY
MLGTLLSDKMQVIVVLNSLPPSWDHIVTSLTHSGKELAMTTLPVLLMLEEDRMKRRKRDNASRHYKINCPLNKRPKNKGKEISMTITEALVIESPPTSWWVDSAATRHIARNRELFVDLKEKQLGEHKVYMGNNTYSDVLGEDKGLIESRDAVFIEDTKLITPLEQIKKLLHTESEESDPHVSVFSDKDLENSGRKRTSPEPAMPSIDADESGRKRQRRPFSMLKDYYLMESKDVAIEDDLANFTKAMESHDAKQWLKAMHEELDSISKNEVWDLTKLSTGRKPVGCKWVLRKKYKADGSLNKYKTRLVAKGFTQQLGVDFVDTYSPVAKFASVRIIMVVAARLDLELHQLDVKTAFLNGDLKEEIYMDQPDGFQIKGQEGKVCRLKKSLYGLKQSSKTMKLTLLSLYVDDILLASNSPNMMKETKFCLGSKFEMKDMGPANYVLGIRISRDRDSKLIYLDQENYLEKVLKRFKMEDCRPVSTPVSKGTILNKRLVSRYQSNPGKAHWQAVKRIFRYLQMTKSMKLCFGLDELEIKGFTNADFAGDTNNRKSTSEYVFLFGGTTVSWLSKKQGCVAKYTMEAEYITCSTAVSNAVWIKRFVDSLKLDMQDKPVNVFCDNKCHNPIFTLEIFSGVGTQNETALTEPD